MVEGEGASVASVWPFWGPLLFGTSALCQGLRRIRTRGWNQRPLVTAKHTVFGDDRDHATLRRVLRLSRELLGSQEAAATIALDDGAAAHYVGRKLIRVVSARPKALGYTIRRRGGSVLETPLSVVRLPLKRA